jgi:hypothetical protein
MEVLAEFNDSKNFNLKLTKDKIYVSALGNEETFALRSVSGVGLYDDIDKYNSDLTKYKQLSSLTQAYITGGIGVGAIIFAALMGSLTLTALFFVIFSIGVGGYYHIANSQIKPKLDSYFRLMLSGADRKFKFDKSHKNSPKVADFINQIEETLTSYNQSDE